MNNAVALLTTGDEVVNGDIDNANAKNLAACLFEAGIPVGHHLSVPDNIDVITQAITHLLKQHSTLIITGGLGPTRDDITRDALAKFLQRDLLIDPDTLHALEDRFKQHKLPFPENNRRQALFPEGATIIKNELGTAAGCHAKIETQSIFMLPGPPVENMPMFTRDVLPELHRLVDETRVFKKWLVFNMPESALANLIDDTLLQYTQHIGYRFDYPYIEIKGFFDNDETIAQCERELNALLKNQQRQLLHEIATQRLATLSASLSHVVAIIDDATGGQLQQRVATPENHQQLVFHTQTDKKADHVIHLTGVTSYWQKSNDTETELMIQSPLGDARYPIRNYGKRSLVLAAEWAAHYLLERLDFS